MSKIIRVILERMNSRLRKVLSHLVKHEVLAYQLRRSGNLKQKLSALPLDDVLILADAYYLKRDKPKDVFSKGLDFGRLAKKKTVYETTLGDYIVYLIGTEADIMYRIDQYLAEQAELLASGESSDIPKTSDTATNTPDGAIREQITKVTKDINDKLTEMAKQLK